MIFMIILWVGVFIVIVGHPERVNWLVCLNSALDPFVYSSLVMKRTGSEGNNNVLDTSFGCLGWRRKQRNKLKQVVKVDMPPKQQLVPAEPDTSMRTSGCDR